MIALHALWREDALCLWGEDSSRPPIAPARRGRPPIRPRPGRHPFACSAAAIEEAVVEFAGSGCRPDSGTTLTT
jgi:hypothetical protein